MTIVKFENNMGFSLTQNDDEVKPDPAEPEVKTLAEQEEQNRRQGLLKRGGIPEFVPLKEMFELYKLFTEANLKNKILVQQAQLKKHSD